MGEATLGRAHSSDMQMEQIHATVDSFKPIQVKQAETSSKGPTCEDVSEEMSGNNNMPEGEEGAEKNEEKSYTNLAQFSSDNLIKYQQDGKTNSATEEDIANEAEMTGNFDD